MASQVRKWGASMFYVVTHCSKKGCDMTWKSSYFQSREQAEVHEAGFKGKPRCLAHAKKKLTKRRSIDTVETKEIT